MQPHRVRLLPLPGLFSRLRLGGGRTVRSALTTPVGRPTRIGVTIAVALMLAVIGLIARTWTAIGDTAISRAGWVAAALGVLVTPGLGTGLMSPTRVAARGAATRLAGRSAEAGSKIEAV